jgi:UDP-N-acetylglucosamine:LPS N-acetylglucosamine transferase
LAEFKPDIVQTFFLDATLFGTLAATLAGVPVIVQSRRSLLVQQEPLAKRVLLRAANRLTRSWQCNSLTVASEVEKTEGLPRKHDGRSSQRARSARIQARHSGRKGGGAATPGLCRKTFPFFFRSEICAR